MPKIVRSNRVPAEDSLDKFDLAILRIMLADSRETLQEIGAKVGLSPTTCWSRIKKLESAGVIRRYTLDLDKALLGYRDSVIVQVTLESHSDETLYEFGRVLATIPEVLEAYLVSGDYDYYIRIAVRDTRDYERLLRERLFSSRRPRTRCRTFSSNTAPSARSSAAIAGSSPNEDVNEATVAASRAFMRAPSAAGGRASAPASAGRRRVAHRRPPPSRDRRRRRPDRGCP